METLCVGLGGCVTSGRSGRVDALTVVTATGWSKIVSCISASDGVEATGVTCVVAT